MPVCFHDPWLSSLTDVAEHTTLASLKVQAGIQAGILKATWQYWCAGSSLISCPQAPLQPALLQALADGAEGREDWWVWDLTWHQATPICRLRPLDAVLSSWLCGKEGALPPVTGLTVQRIICC